MSLTQRRRKTWDGCFGTRHHFSSLSSYRYTLSAFGIFYLCPALSINILEYLERSFFVAACLHYRLESSSYSENTLSCFTLQLVDVEQACLLFTKYFVRSRRPLFIKTIRIVSVLGNAKAGLKRSLSSSFSNTYSHYKRHYNYK